MEDSMIDMPHLAFDEKIGSKRVRDSEEKIPMARLEKRPSGIVGVINVEDYNEDIGQEVAESGNAGGIIDTFISNVFHKNENGVEEEKGNGGQAKSDVFDAEVEEKIEELSGWNVENGGGEGGGAGGGGGGGVINAFFSNIFQNNGSGDGNIDQAKSDLLNEVTDKIEDLGGGEVKDLNEEKLVEKNDTIYNLPNKDLEENKLKMRPDDYSERVFFLNNN